MTETPFVIECAVAATTAVACIVVAIINASLEVTKLSARAVVMMIVRLRCRCTSCLSDNAALLVAEAAEFANIRMGNRSGALAKVVSELRYFRNGLETSLRRYSKRLNSLRFRAPELTG